MGRINEQERNAYYDRLWLWKLEDPTAPYIFEIPSDVAQPMTDNNEIAAGQRSRPSERWLHRWLGHADQARLSLFLDHSPLADHRISFNRGNPLEARGSYDPNHCIALSRFSIDLELTQFFVHRQSKFERGSWISLTPFPFPERVLDLYDSIPGDDGILSQHRFVRWLETVEADELRALLQDFPTLYHDVSYHTPEGGWVRGARLYGSKEFDQLVKFTRDRNDILATGGIMTVKTDQFDMGLRDLRYAY